MVSELNAAKIFAISASKYQDKLTDKILFRSDTILTTVVSFAINSNNILELDRDQFFEDISLRIQVGRLNFLILYSVSGTELDSNKIS